MSNSVGEPCEKVEGSALVSRENVAEVGAVKDVLQCRQDFDPYVRSVFARYESVTVSLGSVRNDLRMYLAE